MKIRTVTLGFNLKMPLSERQVSRMTGTALRIRRFYEEAGYEVQTVRLAFQPWETFAFAAGSLAGFARDLESLVRAHGIDYFSLGTTRQPDLIPRIFEILRVTETAFCTAMVGDGRRIDHSAAVESAKLIKKLAPVSPDGFTNLRFAALFNIGPGCPFFPAAYHDGPASFALGMENSEMVARAFAGSETPDEAAGNLADRFTSAYKPLVMMAETISARERLRFGGLDVSIAPSVKRTESLAFAFEKLGLGTFGGPGTLTAARTVTRALEALPVRTCGYSGLMLPVLEDYGLARRNDQGAYNLLNLLSYSAVCGTGLDSIPLAGNVPERKLTALLLDIANLASKLDKPLSARLLPIPGKAAGERTAFTFPYFVNTRIMDL